jgi:protoporphyrin/coproporphyrin ferrochelatase
MTDGVLLTAHGSVEDLGEMPAFLARIRHGRPAPADLVEELCRRYRAIGGSPLLQTTERQAELLAHRMGAPVFVGMRLSRPELHDALARAADRGVRRLCVLPLAPYSVHVYARAAQQALDRLAPSAPLTLVAAQPFGSDSGLVEAHVHAIEPFLAGSNPQDTELVLTAHSLPCSVIAAGDPYATQVEASARAIGDRLRREHRLAYQSQGADGGEWLGPALRETLEKARDQGRKRVVVAPIGFLCDHVETLYDLDVEAQAWAAELGLVLARVPALNDAPALIDALARVARRALSH